MATTHGSGCRLPDLGDRVAVVTGASSGVGLEVTRTLVARGVRVFMACRDLEKADRSREEVSRESPQHRPVVVPLDLASLESVRECAELLRASCSAVDLLVNNAAVMAVDRGSTADGFETQLGVNYLGHFALTALLLPQMVGQARMPGQACRRIVTTSSNGHRGGRIDLDDLMFARRAYNRWQAYFQSKLALQLFTYELSRRLTAMPSGLMALSAHPGAARTRLGWDGASVTNTLIRWASYLFPTPARGAVPTMRALTDPKAKPNDLFGPRLRVVGAPVRERPSKRARDPVVARLLWERSIALTGCDPGLPPVPAQPDPSTAGEPLSEPGT